MNHTAGDNGLISPLDVSRRINPDDVRNIAILLFLCFVAFLPVFVNPHWGLFTDSREILADCRTFFADPQQIGSNFALLFSHADHRGYRPIFHLIPLLVWLVSPDRPLGFYVFRFFCFAFTVALSYLNCRLLGASNWISLSACLPWFTFVATYEVIYTLDKAEGYLSALFAAMIYVYLHVHREISSSPSNVRSPMVRGSLLIAAISLLAYFIKETGLLLTIFGATACINGAILFLRNKGKQSGSKSNSASAWCVVSGIVTIVGALVFKACEAHASWPVNRYGSVNLTADFIMGRVVQYAGTLPMLSLFIAVACLGPMCLLWRKRPSAFHLDLYGLTAAQLTVVTLAGILALASWPTNLIYIWYPLLAVLLPAVAYWFSVSMTKPVWRITCPIIVCALSLPWLPQALACARFQLQMDRSIEQLAQTLSQLPDTKENAKSIGVPFSSAQSSEIGMSIENYTGNAMQPGFISGRDKKPMSANFFSFIFNSLSTDDRPIDLSKFSQSAIWTNSVQYKSDPSPGLMTVSVEAGAQVPVEYFWYRDKLKVGDILIVPFGNVPVPFVAYRGAEMFSSDWQSKLKFLPQIQVAPYATVQAPNAGFIGGWHLGWVLLKVNRLYPIALAIAEDGWLLENARVAVPISAGKVLKLQSDMQQPNVVTASADRGSIRTVGQPDQHGGLIFSIPLSSLKSKNSESVSIHFVAANPPVSKVDPRHFLMHVTRAWIE